MSQYVHNKTVPILLTVKKYQNVRKRTKIAVELFFDHQETVSFNQTTIF